MTESFGGGGTGAAGPGAGGVAGLVAAGWVPLGGFGCRFFFLHTGRFLRRCFLRDAAASSEEDLAFLWCLRFAGGAARLLPLALAALGGGREVHLSLLGRSARRD